MRIFRTSAGLCSWALLFCGGCTDTLQVERFTGVDQSEGVCYSLPQTFVQVSLVYTVDQITYTNFGETTIETGNEIRVQYPISIEPRLVPDEKSKFVIKANNLQQGLFLAANLGYGMDDQGILTSVDTTVSDRSVATLHDLGTTAVEFGKIAARGNAAPSAAKLKRRIDELYDELADYPMSDPTTQPSILEGPAGRSRELPSGHSPEAAPAHASAAAVPTTRPTNPLEARLLLLHEAIKFYQEDHNVSVKPIQIPCAFLLDPAQFTRSDEGILECTISPPRIFNTVDIDHIPSFTVQIFDQNVQANAAGGAHGDRFPGIVYRPPCGVLTRVIDPRTKAVLASQILSFPQYSPLMVMRVDVKPFSDKATAMTFSSVSGGIKTVNLRTGSSGEDVAKTTAAAGADANAVVKTTEDSSDKQNGNKSSKKNGDTHGSKTSGGQGNGASGNGHGKGGEVQ